MEKITRYFGEVCAAYLIGLLCTAYFYLPAKAAEELARRQFSEISPKEWFWYFVAFSMAAAFGLCIVNMTRDRWGSEE